MKSLKLRLQAFAGTVGSCRVSESTCCLNTVKRKKSLPSALLFYLIFRMFVCVVISRSAGYFLLRTERRRRITIAQARLAIISNAMIPMMLP